MKTLLNIIWLIFGGFFSAIGWFIIGVILTITIIGIPLGKQCFKMARLVLWPVGTVVDSNYQSHPIANVIWAILVGIWMAIGNIVSALICAITIIGIPLALQWIKIAKLSLFPFGAKIK